MLNRDLFGGQTSVTLKVIFKSIFGVGLTVYMPMFYYDFPDGATIKAYDK